MGILVVGSVSCGEKDSGTVAVMGEHAQKGEFDYAETVGNIVFCGNNIKMPCTFSGFGDGFTAKDGVVLESGIGTYFHLDYNDEEVGGIVLADCKANDDVADKNIVRIDINATEKCSINGIDCSDTFNKIEQTIGTPTYTDDFHAKYAESENQYVEFKRASKNSKDIVEVTIFNG
ncbi:MAG: hypothetical protein K2K91_01590 [Ruminococcus sp.]|nr:hypothetical protein [Ruminococcus sp.]